MYTAVLSLGIIVLPIIDEGISNNEFSVGGEWRKIYISIRTFFIIVKLQIDYRRGSVFFFSPHGITDCEPPPPVPT